MSNERFYYFDYAGEEIEVEADLTDEEIQKVKTIFDEALLRD